VVVSVTIKNTMGFVIDAIERVQITIKIIMQKIKIEFIHLK